MKIAICDDDKQELLQISELVDEFLRGNLADSKSEVFSFDSSMNLQHQIEAGKHFDIFLLDVIMPGINGIKLATEIRARDQVAKIIFLTASSQFAIDSYSVGAFHYLLKPVQKNPLFSVLEKARHDLNRRLQQFIVVKTPFSLTRVFLHQLIYVEVIRRTVFFHLADGTTIESNRTIAQVEDVLLSDNRFIKPHRSYIVNLDYIKDLSPDGLALIGGLSVPVSRNLFKKIKEAYIHYSFPVEE